MSSVVTDWPEFTASNLHIKDRTLDYNGLATYCPLDNGRQLTTAPRADLGPLKILPQELLAIIFHYLDLQTLTIFRRVNRQAMHSVDAIPAYAILIRHAPNTIRGMLSLGSARFNTSQDRYETLCTESYEICGDFGGYIYLIKCRRVCFLCYSHELSYLTVTRSDVLRKFGLEAKQLRDIPHVRSRPGSYSLHRALWYGKSVILFDQDSVRRAARATYGTEEALQEAVALKAQALEDKLREKQRTYEIGGGRGKKPRLPRTEQVEDKFFGNPFRFMAIESAPFYDKQRRVPEEGFYCLGFLDELGLDDLHWRKRYTVESFKRHMARWGEVSEMLEHRISYVGPEVYYRHRYSREFR